MPVPSQTAPDWQVLPQHGLPGVPHAAHIPPVHTNPIEQAEPPQQSCEAPTQPTQVPPLPQTFPGAHVEPPQHGCPGPPHVPQVPAVEQVTPLSALQRCPLQQSWPTPPQVEQVPTAHTASPVHVSPAQHGRPGVPHMTTDGRSPAPSPFDEASGADI
jgi:hypothetical protein